MRNTTPAPADSHSTGMTAGHSRERVSYRRSLAGSRGGHRGEPERGHFALCALNLPVRKKDSDASLILTLHLVGDPGHAVTSVTASAAALPARPSAATTAAWKSATTSVTASATAAGAAATSAATAERAGAAASPAADLASLAATA
jgi:hypothetical protein